MKMYDKNGKLSIVAKVIFEANMKRLRMGDDPMDIIHSMKEQVAILQYNGDPQEIPDVPPYSRPLRIKPVEYAVPEWFDTVEWPPVGTIFPEWAGLKREPISREEIQHVTSTILPRMGWLKPKSSKPIVIDGTLTA